jgi:hypothetical protein
MCLPVAGFLVQDERLPTSLCDSNRSRGSSRDGIDAM